MHPARNAIVHLDMQRVVETEKIRIHIPIHFKGEAASPGVKSQGGVVSHRIADVEISCLPKDLPEFIELDLSQMEMNESKHLSDLPLPEGVTIPSIAKSRCRGRHDPSAACGRAGTDRRSRCRNACRRRCCCSGRRCGRCRCEGWRCEGACWRRQGRRCRGSREEGRRQEVSVWRGRAFGPAPPLTRCTYAARRSFVAPRLFWVRASSQCPATPSNSSSGSAIRAPNTRARVTTRASGSWMNWRGAMAARSASKASTRRNSRAYESAARSSGSRSR